ncbi:MAG: trigger factor [Lachnospiraceae bacterium]|nr:trigger factor [Lachnospiraceae bacterium]
MSVKVEKLEKNMAKLTIEASAEEFEQAVKKAYNKNKGKMSVPGFRKGKVPQAMIEKMYGPEVFYEDAANFIIPDAYANAIEEEKDLEIVSRPKIDVEQCEKGKPFIFTAEVALKPDVDLGKYKGVKIEKIETAVTDEDIDKEIKREQEANARTITVTDRPVKDGDTAVIDFEGFVDGVAFEGGKGENYPLVIGSGSFIPGFEDQIIGKNTGDDCDVNVTFPEDYNAKDLAGKDAVFKVKVNEIKEKELPELDDEFASEVSEFDTMAEYREDVKKKLAEKKEKEAKDKKEDAVIEAIIKDSKMEIPEPMIDTNVDNMISDYAQRLQSQGLSLEQYFMFTGLDMDKFRSQMREGAVKRIESRLVLDAIVAAEDFSISDEEYEKELERIAEESKMEINKLKEYIGDDEYGKNRIIDDLKIQKAIDLITESAVEKK